MIETGPREIGFVLRGHCQNLLDDPRTYYPYVLIAYTFKGQVHVFAGGVKIVSHSFCRTSAIFKYVCTLPNIRGVSQ